MHKIIAALLLCAQVFANTTQWTTEALNNIMSMQDQDEATYFTRIERYFTAEAFTTYKNNFSKTNMPLIRELKLTMSGRAVEALQVDETNETQFNGKYILTFQGTDIDLTQDLAVKVSIAKDESDQPRISQLSFDKLSDAKIKMKSYEQLAMCKKRKEQNANKE